MGLGHRGIKASFLHTASPLRAIVALVATAGSSLTSPVGSARLESADQQQTIVVVVVVVVVVSGSGGVVGGVVRGGVGGGSSVVGVGCWVVVDVPGLD